VLASVIAKTDLNIEVDVPEPDRMLALIVGMVSNNIHRHTFKHSQEGSEVFLFGDHLYDVLLVAEE
jgi:hypothetical protein